MKRLISLLALVLVAAITVAGCARSAPAPASPKPTAAAPVPTAVAPKPAPSPAPAAKPAPKLPGVITVATGQVGQGIHTRDSALREAIEKSSGIKVRLQPMDNDVLQAGLLQLGQAEIGDITGPTIFAAASGDHKQLGKVKVRRVWNGSPFTGYALTRADSGIKSLAEVKGKRVPQTAASASYSSNVEAVLAFAGLTLKDVRVINVSSIAAGSNALGEDKVDMSIGTPWSPWIVELAASRHGIFPFDLSASNIEGWKRAQAIKPSWNPIVTAGAGLEKGKTITSYGYEEGLWSTPQVPDDVIYALAKAMKDGYGLYKDMDKSLAAWTWERAYSLEGVQALPYHPGTVKFFKDMGVWTAQHEKLQQEALRLEEERLKK